MPLSFEELANEGIPQDALTHHSSNRSMRLTAVASLSCITILSALAYHFLLKSDLPEAAEILLSVDGDISEVLPHTLDSATEFNESFDSLKEGEPVPEYRETEEGSLSTMPAIAAVAEPEEQSDIQDSPTIVSAGAALVKAPEAPTAAPTTQIDQPELLAQTPASLLKLPSETAVELPRDWGGLVLVPDTAKLAKAYTSDVRLARVEAHPIDGERIRVWARIQNLTDAELQSEVGCEFRSSNYSQYASAHFEPSIIPENGVIDVYFESPHDRVESYTVMVKRVE